MGAAPARYTVGLRGFFSVQPASSTVLYTALYAVQQKGPFLGLRRLSSVQSASSTVL